MARSIRWPPELNDGRLAWTDGPGEAVEQVVRLTLTAGPSANPFWPDTTPIKAFDAIDRGTESRIRLAVGSLFVRLQRERRARLVAVVFTREPGALRVAVDYDDLETGRRAGVAEVLRA